jgi:TP901 family phage tail tape measure protein
MAVKTITANLNVVPVGIENTKAKFQELLKSANISPAIRLDIEKVLSKIDEIAPRIQGQLSGKGALNIDRMGFGKLDELIFKVAKNISKELGVAFDTTKVDEYAKKIDDVNSKINANQTALNVNEKDMTKAKAKITEESQGLAPGMRGEDAEVKVKERIVELEKEMGDTVNKSTKKYVKMKNELKDLNAFLKENKTIFEKVTKLQEKEIVLNKEKATLAGELYNLTVAQEQATNQAISEIPEVVKANAAVKEYTDAKSQLIKATMDQAQANADAAQSELDVDDTQKKSKKSLLEKIFALFSFQKVMQFVNRTVRDAVKTIKDLDKAITDMALVTTLSREEAWKLVGAMQNLATQTGLATSQIAGVIVQFIRQGRSVADAFELAEVAAKSAKVAGIDASEAVDYLTAAVNGFGLAATGAEDIADKFAAIAAKSASSFEELALAMSKVAPTAKSAGVSVDFMMGVIAKGIETTREAPENIGTAFKTIFARMREVTDLGKAMEDGMSLNRVEKALLSIGVPLRDNAGQFRNLETVLTDVGRKWEDLTSVEQAYLATALAGSRQQPRLLAIFNDFARTEELISVSAGAAGELEDQHLEYMEGLEAALVSMKNAWEQVVTAFMSSEVIITIVNFLSAGFSTVADVLGGMGNPIQVTTVALIGLTVALGLYTLAKAKATAAEQLSNAQGALTTLQIIKLNMLRGASAGAISFETAAQLARNNTMREAITLYFMEIAEKIKLAIYSFAYATALKTETLAQVIKNHTMKEAIIQAGIDLFLKAKNLVMSARQFIIDKATIALNKIKLFFQTALNKEARTEAFIRTVSTIVAIKDNIVKAATIVWNTLLSISNLGLAGTFWVVISAVITLASFLGPFLLVGAAVALLIVGLIAIFNYATKSVDSFAKNIAKANSAMRELENKEKNIKKLTERFDELNNTVEKSIEDLDEMNSIAKELSEVKVGDQTFAISREDAFGNLMIDEEEYQRYLKASAAERQKLLEQESTELNKAVARFGAEAMDNEVIADSARRAGYRMVEEMIGGLEEGNTELEKKVSDSVKQALAKTDMSAFVKRGFFGDFLDTKALENYTKLQTELFTDYYKEIAVIEATEARLVKNQEKTATEARVESIEERMRVYNEAIDAVEARTDLTEEQKLELIANINLTMSGEAALIELIENRGIDVELVANMQISGMDLNEIGGFLQNSLNMANNAAGVTGEGAATEEQLAGAQTAVGIGNAAGTAVDFLASMFTFGLYQGDFFSQAIDNLTEGQQGILDAHETAEQEAQRLFEENNEHLSEIFSGENLSQDMQEYRQFLIEEMNLTADQADAEMNRLYNALGTKSSAAIAGLISDTKTARGKLYSLPEELAKGNFEGLVDLATEYGAEAVEAFMSGDPAEMEDFFAAQKQKTLADINDSIQALEGLGEENLSDAQKAELLALRTMLEYYDQMSDADQERTYWLGKAKNLISEMNDILKIVGDLMTLGLSEDHPLITMLNSLADAKYESSIDSLQSSLDNEMEALSEFGRFDENGVFTFDEGADMVAGQATLDGYLDTLGDYTNTLVAEYNRQADVIKKRYQGEMDAIKDAHSERWKEIEYLDKVKELEGKIMDARRQLMAFSLDSSMAGQMTDSLESLQKIQQERQKMIEQRMMEEAQKQLEAERDDALLALGQQQITTMEGLITSLGDLNDTILGQPKGQIVVPTSGGGGKGKGNLTLANETMGIN